MSNCRFCLRMCFFFLSQNVLSLERIHAIFRPLLHRINKPLAISISFDIHNYIYNNMYRNYEPLDEFISLMAARLLTICIVYCNIWFRTKHLRKQSIRSIFISQTTILFNQNLLVVSLLTVTVRIMKKRSQVEILGKRIF